jgi:hypothetical protein
MYLNNRRKWKVYVKNVTELINTLTSVPGSKWIFLYVGWQGKGKEERGYCSPLVEN